MSKFDFDCVFYFQGGTEDGQWHKAVKGSRREILAAGFPAVDGSSLTGPPEGYPRASLRKKVNEICGHRIWDERPWCFYCGEFLCHPEDSSGVCPY